VTRPNLDLAGQQWALYSLRILIVFALADISLRWIELPIRSGVIQYWFKGLKYRTKSERRKQKLTFSLIGVVIALLASLISVRAIEIGNQERAALKASLESTPTISARTENGLWITGDSVILGIRAQLSEATDVSLVNARIGRQAAELLDVIVKDKAQVPESPVLFNLGNNNALTREQVVAIFEAVKDQPQVIVVNTAVPRPWRDTNNSLIGEVASQYPRVNIVDWNSISEGHPEYFAPDGVHLVPTGVSVYVAEIMKVLS